MTAPSIKEALELARNTLVALRTRLKTEPSVQGRGWVSLGIVTNDAIEKADRALATFQPDSERREAIARALHQRRYGKWYEGPCAPTDSPRECLEEADWLLWRTIESAPHETYVLLGWMDDGKWNCTTGFASQGWRRNGVSNISKHSQATHWRHLPAGPIRSARNGGEG